jgi:twitching motility protein PilT
MPSVKQNGAFVPIERAPVSEAELAAALQEIGGSPHLAKLGEKPVSWNTAIDGLGVVAIVALRRGGILQARLVLKKGEDSVAPEPPSSSHLAAAKPVEATPTSNVSARSPRSGQSAETSTGPEGNLVTSLPDALFAILEAARSQRATDVHVVADRPTSFRKSGALVPQGSPISAANAAAMLHGIVPARLEPVFERAGSCDFALADARLGRFRVNVARQRTGIKGCFRLISREVPALTSLGLPPSLVEAVQHHHGLVLVTGPTGSGKSTTLAALIDLLNRETSHHIITIEDPIEHVHTPKKALLSQREVGSHTRSFETALKGALRQDPDVIVVGELRDTETVRMALVASETGHLVLATMNTPSASKTIDRLIDLFPPGDQGQVRMSLAGGLRMIVGQRLVPTQDGGLVAAAETLPGCVPLWALIRDGRTFQIPSLQQRGKQLGIVRLDEQLQELVRGGRISMDAARFVAESPEFGRTA